MANSIIFPFEGFCARCIITILKYVWIPLLTREKKQIHLAKEPTLENALRALVAAPKSRMTECR
jgi:hypothetical protein